MGTRILGLVPKGLHRSNEDEVTMGVPIVLDFPKKAIEKAFSEKMKAHGFEVRRSRGLIAWRNLEYLQQRVYLDKTRGEPYLNLEVTLKFGMSMVSADPPGFDSACDFVVGELGLANEDQRRLVLTSLWYYPPHEVEVRVHALNQLIDELIIPWLNEYTSAQPLIDRINPESGHVDPPGLALRSFYDFIGRLPKVWPRPIP